MIQYQKLNKHSIFLKKIKRLGDFIEYLILRIKMFCFYPIDLSLKSKQILNIKLCLLKIPVRFKSFKF